MRSLDNRNVRWLSNNNVSNRVMGRGVYKKFTFDYRGKGYLKKIFLEKVCQQVTKYHSGFL